MHSPKLFSKLTKNRPLLVSLIIALISFGGWIAYAVGWGLFYTAASVSTPTDNLVYIPHWCFLASAPLVCICSVLQALDLSHAIARRVIVMFYAILHIIFILSGIAMILDSLLLILTSAACITFFLAGCCSYICLCFSCCADFCGCHPKYRRHSITVESYVVFNEHAKWHSLPQTANPMCPVDQPLVSQPVTVPNTYIATSQLPSAQLDHHGVDNPAVSRNTNEGEILLPTPNSMSVPPTYLVSQPQSDSSECYDMDRNDRAVSNCVQRDVKQKLTENSTIQLSAQQSLMTVQPTHPVTNQCPSVQPVVDTDDPVAPVNAKRVEIKKQHSAIYQPLVSQHMSVQPIYSLTNHSPSEYYVVDDIYPAASVNKKGVEKQNTSQHHSTIYQPLISQPIPQQPTYSVTRRPVSDQSEYYVRDDPTAPENTKRAEKQQSPQHHSTHYQPLISQSIPQQPIYSAPSQPPSDQSEYYFKENSATKDVEMKQSSKQHPTIYQPLISQPIPQQPTYSVTSQSLSDQSEYYVVDDPTALVNTKQVETQQSPQHHSTIYQPLISQLIPQQPTYSAPIQPPSDQSEYYFKENSATKDAEKEQSSQQHPTIYQPLISQPISQQQTYSVTSQPLTDQSEYYVVDDPTALVNTKQVEKQQSPQHHSTHYQPLISQPIPQQPTYSLTSQPLSDQSEYYYVDDPTASVNTKRVEKQQTPQQHSTIYQPLVPQPIPQQPLYSLKRRPLSDQSEYYVVDDPAAPENTKQVEKLKSSHPHATIYQPLISQLILQQPRYSMTSRSPSDQSEYYYVDDAVASVNAKRVEKQQSPQHHSTIYQPPISQLIPQQPTYSVTIQPPSDQSEYYNKENSATKEVEEEQSSKQHPTIYQPLVSQPIPQQPLYSLKRRPLSDQSEYYVVDDPTAYTYTQIMPPIQSDDSVYQPLSVPCIPSTYAASQLELVHSA